eukprot:scaffold40110_cov53-Attheya_sp.AAC.1
MTRVHRITPLAKESQACAKAPSILDEDKSVSVRDDKTEKFEKPIDRIRRKYSVIRRSKSSSSTKATIENRAVDKQSPLYKDGKDKIERPFDRIMKRFMAIRGVSLRSLKKSSLKYNDYDDGYGDDGSILVNETEGDHVGNRGHVLHKQMTIPPVMKASVPPAKFENYSKNGKDDDSSIMSPTSSSMIVDKKTMNVNLGGPSDDLDESFNCLVGQNAALQVPSLSPSPSSLSPTKPNLFEFMNEPGCGRGALAVFADVLLLLCWQHIVPQLTWIVFSLILMVDKSYRLPLIVIGSIPLFQNCSEHNVTGLWILRQVSRIKRLK